jgi:hypothetical protein
MAVKLAAANLRFIAFEKPALVSFKGKQLFHF